MKSFFTQIIFIAMMIFAIPTLVLAQQVDQDVASQSAADVVDQSNWQHLDALVNAIDEKRSELTVLHRKLAASQDEFDRAHLKKAIEQIDLDLESLQVAWEMVATGGADLGLFGVKTETAFNWRTELQSVFEPILVELKRLTERPRKIERLRNDQVFYQRRLDVAESALKKIIEYRKNAPSSTLKTAFSVTEQRWQKRRDDLESRLQLIDFELQEMFSPDKESQRDPVQSLQELMSGRLLNLLIGAGVMVLVYLILRSLVYVYSRYLRHKPRHHHSLMVRVGSLLYYLFTTVLVLFAGMAVFYMLGDWLLLGLFVIMLVGAAWALQRSLPHYIMEAKLLLNLGPVREGERLIYHELPWQVKSLGFYTTLSNPLLDGGTLLIPLRELVDYNSREYNINEPWFPTCMGDYVILDDGSYGTVITQTPEIVQLDILGAIKTYPVTAFLEQSPRNLSQQGFKLLMTFGLDYQHQDLINTTISTTLEQELTASLSTTDIAPFMTSLAVEFGQAGTSSLDLVVIASFSGAAADAYFVIQRLLQRLAVDACNKHHWVIPFNQITVHQAS
jgi:hypothetical protein